MLPRQWRQRLLDGIEVDWQTAPAHVTGWDTRSRQKDAQGMIAYECSVTECIVKGQPATQSENEHSVRSEGKVFRLGCNNDGPGCLLDLRWWMTDG